MFYEIIRKQDSSKKKINIFSNYIYLLFYYVIQLATSASDIDIKVHVVEKSQGLAPPLPVIIVTSIVDNYLNLNKHVICFNFQPPTIMIA